MNFYFNPLTYKKPTGGRFFVRISQRVLLAFITLIPTMTFAQDEALSAVDLRTAITQTVNMHPELRSFAIQTEMYSGYAQQAGITSRPQIDFTVEDALGTGDHSGLKSAQSTLSISWLLDGDLVERKVKTAKHYGSTVAIEREVKALDLAAQTARYFVQVLVNKERLTLSLIHISEPTRPY